MNVISGSTFNHTKAKYDIMEEVHETQAGLAALKEVVRQLQIDDTSKDCREATQRLIKIIDGDPTTDIIGLRQRVKTLEIVVEALQEDKKQTQATLKGIVIGLALTGFSSTGTLITMLIQVFGGKP